MYQVGDLIVYGSTGVCKVLEVSYPSISHIDKNKLYYCLKPLYQNGTIYTPIDNTKVFMRPILSKEQANSLIDQIPHMKVQAYHSHVLSDLTAHYSAALNSHNCKDLVALTMSIYAKQQAAAAQKKKFGSVDEKYMRRAEDLLFGELAVSLQISKGDVPRYIAERISTNSENGSPV